MLECPACGGQVPEVEGASEQVCPVCGHRFTPGSPATAVPRRAGSPGEVLGQALRVYRAAPLPALALWILPVLVGVAVGFLLPTADSIQNLTNQANAPGLTTAQQAALLGQMAGVLGTVIGLLLVLGVFVGIAMAATVGLASAHQEGRRPILTDAIAPLRQHPGAIVATSVVLAILTVVGLVLFILPALLVVHWFLFALPMAGEGAGPREALGGSLRVARRRRTLGFTFFVVGLVLLLDLAGGMLQSLAALATIPQVDLLVAAVGALASWILAPIIPLFAALAMLELRTVPEASPQPWGAPAPGAAAPAPTGVGTAGSASGAREFHTVTCPDCGAIVPFYVEEGENRVQCPTCGKVGFVRRDAEGT